MDEQSDERRQEHPDDETKGDEFLREPAVDEAEDLELGDEDADQVKGGFRNICIGYIPPPPTFP